MEEKKVPLQVNNNNSNETSNDDTKSVAAVSAVSRIIKAKCGALNKHCTTGNCVGKLITGNNWAQHVKAFH